MGPYNPDYKYTYNLLRGLRGLRGHIIRSTDTIGVISTPEPPSQSARAFRGRHWLLELQAATAGLKSFENVGCLGFRV